MVLNTPLAHTQPFGRIITEEPVRAANDQSFVHAHRNSVDIRVRTRFRGVEVGNSILMFQ